MSFSWIVNKWYQSGIDPLAKNLITVDSVPEREDYPIKNMFLWNNNKYSRTILQSSSPHNVTFSFSKPISIYKYKIQIPQVIYLTGWQFEVSYDGSFFTIVDDQKETKFCSTDQITENGIINCGELTTRTFEIPLSTAKSLRISMTKPDSSNSYRMEFSGVDFYIAKTNFFLYLCSCFHSKSLNLNIRTLLFIILKT